MATREWLYMGSEPAPLGRHESYPGQYAARPEYRFPGVFVRAGTRRSGGIRKWFASLSGDYRRGADWWTGHRSLPHAGTCNGPAAAMNQQFTLGCEAAKARLASKDVKRKSDPDYKRGWNSYTGSSPPPVAEARVPTAEQGAPAESEATDADSVKRLNEQELRQIMGH